MSRAMFAAQNPGIGESIKVSHIECADASDG